MRRGGFILPFLGGAAIGAVVALLTAPASGKETRRQIGKGIEEGHDWLMDTMDEVKDEFNKKKKEVANALDAAKKECKRQKEVMHDAIKEAKKEYKEIGEKLRTEAK